MFYNGVFRDLEWNCSMLSLDNKVAIITGASSGIGRAAATLFAKQGAKLVLAARRATELEELVREIEAAGGQAVALAGDVVDEDYSEALVELCLERFGRLDIGFNNAGTLGACKSLDETSLEAWQQTLATNLTGGFLGARYQIPAMVKSGGGSVIFTSSFVGHRVGFPEMVDYAASKAGQIGMTLALAAEFASSGVRVNALLPGGTDTPMGRDSANTDAAMDFVCGLHAMKRIARPEEIAQSALFLASDASSFTTGTTLFADGGVSINRG